MFCIRSLSRKCVPRPAVGLAHVARYSRRSDNRNTSSYKVVGQAKKDDRLDDFESSVFGVNPNWELLTPRGFRFYLPGSIGPGWLDASTTAQVEIRSKVIPNQLEDAAMDDQTSGGGGIDAAAAAAAETRDLREGEKVVSVLECAAQECPTLLRKGIMELFPACLEVTSPQLSIVTISQRLESRASRWSREAEVEKLAQHFVLAASDICQKLKMCGYWADFINPFSGQPYFSPFKNNVLYKTDERFRCVGFKIEKKQNCKVIKSDNDGKTFIGNLYTTAPWSTEFLKGVMNNVTYKPL